MTTLHKSCANAQQRYTQNVDFAQLKSELQLHEKNDLTLMKAENDRLMADVEKLKQRLREEITRTQAGVRLDINLEKGRIRDESAQQELKIKEVDTRIESEIAGLRTQIEQAKFSILQYLVGVATGSGALLLAYMRMMVSFSEWGHRQRRWLTWNRSKRCWRTRSPSRCSALTYAAVFLSSQCCWDHVVGSGLPTLPGRTQEQQRDWASVLAAILVGSDASCFQLFSSSGVCCTQA